MKIKIFFLISAMNALSYSGYEECCDCWEECFGNKKEIGKSEGNGKKKNHENVKKDENEKSEEDENEGSYHNASLTIKNFSNINTEGFELIEKNSLNVQKQYVKIGIIGEKEEGKTFLYEKLFDIKKDSNSMPTQDLNFKYNERKNLMVIENQLLHPFSYFKKEEIKKNIEELNNLEDIEVDYFLKYKFTEEFIKSYSDLMIIVCGKIENDEDIVLLNNLINQYRYPISSTKLVVLHKIEKIDSIASLNEYIDDTVEKIRENIPLKKRRFVKINEDDLDFTFYEQENQKNVFHIFIANDNSDEIKNHNKNAIQYLNTHLNTGIFNSLSIPEQIKKTFTKFSDKIYKEEINIDNFFTIKNNEKKIIRYDGELTYRENLNIKIKKNIEQEKYWEEDIITYDKTECSEEFLFFHFKFAEEITYAEIKNIEIDFDISSGHFLHSVFWYKDSSGYENKYELKYLLTDNEVNEIEMNAEQYDYEIRYNLLIFKIPNRKKIKKKYD